MKVYWLFGFLVPGLAMAQAFPVSQLQVDGIYATRLGDPALYCILGANACLLPGVHDARTQDDLIPRWLKEHPNAVALPVSSRSWNMGPRDQPPSELHSNLWISDGTSSLNVALVEAGRYSAGIMVDMVEAEEALEKQLNSTLQAMPGTAGFMPLQIPDKQRAHRLVSDAAYADMKNRLSAAEKNAINAKRGIWSEEGLKGRAAPTDDFLIRKFHSERDAFDRLQVLVSEHPELITVNQYPGSWTRARGLGVEPGVVDEYVGILRRLGANEELADVVGAGQVCLVMADILVGFFDNGIIKGYAYLPSSPDTVLDSLDQYSQQEQDATIAYRPVVDNWYLFEIIH